MCENCKDGQLGRRRFLKLGAAGLAAIALGAAGTAARAAGGPTTSMTPDQALAALKDGNAKYVAQPQLCVADLAKTRGTAATGQAPWATVIACSDSRSAPELIFGGKGLGELFVARNAGNMVDTATLGSVEYGAAVLGAPLLVVLGHQSCGAVVAATEVVEKNATFPGAIGRMVDPIIPAALAAKGQPGDYVTNAIKESARRTTAALPAQSTLLAGLAKDGKLKIVGAYYDIATGAVSWL